LRWGTPDCKADKTPSYFVKALMLSCDQIVAALCGESGDTGTH